MLAINKPDPDIRNPLVARFLEAESQEKSARERLERLALESPDLKSALDCFIQAETLKDDAAASLRYDLSERLHTVLVMRATDLLSASISPADFADETASLIDDSLRATAKLQD